MSCSRCGDEAFAVHDDIALCLHHTIQAILRIMRMEREGWITPGSMKLRLLNTRKEVART